MTEFAKTFTLVVVAAVVAAAAYFSRPSQPVMSTQEMVGEELFPDFTDPLKATSLEILKYDEATAAIEPFKVAQVDGRWSIPSHDGYPADAKDQLADVAKELMVLKVLSVASDDPGDQALYGVVDPNPETLEAGASGVGTRVTMKDKDDKTLVSIIVGKEVPDEPDLRYVRRANEDPIYTVALSTGKLSTNFGDWIEKDLLKLNGWDIEDVEVRDYSIDELQNAVSMRNRFVLDYDDTGNPKWTLAEDQIFDQGEAKWIANPKPITDDEELDIAKLDALRQALDDLKIVDVAKKPTGLSEDLRNVKGAESLMKSREALASLQERGFYLVPWEDHMELMSTMGEIHTTTKDGVKYILRFGNIAGGGDQSPAGDDKADETAESKGGVNRFLFVMVEFDPNAVEKPTLEPLPEKPAAEEAKKADAEKESQNADDAETDAAAKEENPEPNVADDAAKEETPETNDADAAKTDDASEAQKEYEAEVQRIERENKQKQDDYDEAIKKGEEKVKELSDRFADWYYVISNDVYEKIHLSRDGIIKEKEKKTEEGSEAEPTETTETP